MTHAYMLFDFGNDEEKLQQANHKLQGWKQAYRLDKKLQFKFDRGDAQEPGTDQNAEEGKAKSHGKHKESSSKTNVTLLVRLYFSAHEKITAQQWMDRIPKEEPFKSALRKTITEGEPEFSETQEKFENLA